MKTTKRVAGRRAWSGVLGGPTVLAMTLLMTANDGGLRAQCLMTEDDSLGFCAPGSNRMGQALGVDGNVLVVGVPYSGRIASQGGEAWVFEHDGTEWSCEPTGELFHANLSVAARFGTSVDVSGDYIIVGAPQQDLPVTLDQAGAAYIFEKHPLFGWQFQQQITAPSPAVGDNFGYDVGIDGDVAVIGAHKRDVSGQADSGEAYVYRRSGGGWNLEQILTQNLLSASNFGTSVCLQGNRIVVGAPLDYDTQGATRIGSAYVYDYDPSVSFWNLSQTLWGSNTQASSRFGFSVAADGDVIAVGAPYQDANKGVAYAFRQDPSSLIWNEEQELLPQDRVLDTGNMFYGWSVSVLADVIAVGAVHADDSGVTPGACYTHRFDGSSIWLHERKLVASNGVNNGNLGDEVCLYGDTVLVGGPEMNGAKGAVLEYTGLSGLRLTASPTTVFAGNTLTFDAHCGQPNDRIYFAVIVVDGIPFFQVLFRGAFGVDQRWSLSTPVPPGLPVPFDMTFQAYRPKIPSGLTGSNPVTVEFR